MADDSAMFKQQLAAFEIVAENAVRISQALEGRSESQRNAWISYIHARLCANSVTLLLLLDRSVNQEPGYQLLDHFSVASIGRTAMEAGLMILYLSNPALSDDEWELRKAVIDLHDATNRYRMFKPVKRLQPRDECYGFRI